VAAAVRSDREDRGGHLRAGVLGQDQVPHHQSRKVHSHQEIQAVQGRRRRITHRHPRNHGPLSPPPPLCLLPDNVLSFLVSLNQIEQEPKKKKPCLAKTGHSFPNFLLGELVQLLREISHENVVKLVNVHINHADMSLYLAFDYAEHDLYVSAIFF
jgi:hypothetical protein